MSIEDLHRAARSAARSQIRLQTQIHENLTPALLAHEQEILDKRKDQLTLLIDSARAIGDLPTREALMFDVLLAEDAGTAEEGELGVAAAILLAALDSE
ncbi:MAG TPA: hypothetical protein VFH61_14020 [Thermoleophilia bacterium]|nr:hypothetical protein [Thermoleophilia bacterium]